MLVISSAIESRRCARGSACDVDIAELLSQF